MSQPLLADEMIDGPVKAKAAKTGKAAKAKSASGRTTAGNGRASRPVIPATGAARSRAPAPAPADGAALPGSAEKPPVSDPRIDKLMEGARKAWESVGQPAGGDATKPAPPTASTSTAADRADLEELKATFRRPPDARTVPSVDAIAALGARLFSETKLSSDHKMSCATCHDPAKSLSDGRARSASRLPEASRRNTPSLWNVGFAKSFGWKGGFATLEAQVKAEVEREGEMDGTLEAAVVWLSRDATYIQAFDRAFGRSNALSTATVATSLAAYLKTLTSPTTRFDRWTEGNARALDDTEIEGLRVFVGKGGCAACHSGWRFTDDAARSSAGRAVKTPSLREATWSAPYMLDGRAKSLGAAVSHAAKARGASSLTATERAALVAFVKTLSSDQRPVALTPPQ